MNDFEKDMLKAQQDRVDAICKSFVNYDEDSIEKGQKAGIGEIRDWGGKKYKKQANGKWMEVSEHVMTRKEHIKQAEIHVEATRPSYNSEEDAKARKHLGLAEKLSNKEYSDEEVGIKEDSGISIQEKDGNTLLKKNGKVYGYVKESKDGGYSYNIGKPSDGQVSTFTGNEKPLTKEQAIERLKNAIR